MQAKMPKRRGWAARYHEWAMRRGFPLLIRIAPRMPRWLLHFGARVVITLVMMVYRSPNAEIERNLSQVTGLPAGSRRLRRARRKMFYNLATYWVDLFHFCQLPYEKTRQVLEGLRGLEHLEEAVAAGRGVILLTAHLGNWELGGVFLREIDQRITVVYVPDHSPSAEEFRTFLREQIDVEAIPLDLDGELSSLPLLRALRDGRVVAMQGDRDFNDRGSRFDFFGAPAPFPKGPFYVARLTGAVVIPAFIVYNDRHGIEIELGPTLEMPRTRDRESDIHQVMEQWVEVLEDAVSRWPTQWYTFYDFWAGGSAQPGFDAPQKPGREEAVG